MKRRELDIGPEYIIVQQINPPKLRSVSSGLYFKSNKYYFVHWWELPSALHP